MSVALGDTVAVCLCAPSLRLTVGLDSPKVPRHSLGAFGALRAKVKREAGALLFLQQSRRCPRNGK
jgi:hypothetical protein